MEALYIPGMTTRSRLATRLSRVTSAKPAPTPTPPPRAINHRSALCGIPEDLDVSVPRSTATVSNPVADFGAPSEFLPDLHLPDADDVPLLGDARGCGTFSITDDALFAPNDISALPPSSYAENSSVAEGVAQHLRGGRMDPAKPGDSLMASMYGGSMPHPIHGAVSGPIGFATQMFQRAQAPPAQVTASQFRGVTRPLFTASWDAHVICRGERVYLGTYSCEEMAARAYDVGVLKLNGVKTNLNFNVSEYDERGLEQMQGVPPDELVQGLIQQAKSAHARSSKFRGVWGTDSGKFESKYIYDIK